MAPSTSNYLLVSAFGSDCGCGELGGTYVVVH